MTAQLEMVIDAARSLPREQQHRLIEALLEQLNAKPSLEHMSKGFWHPRSIQELAAEQQVRVVEDVKDLVVDFWPKDEAVEDFLTYIYQQRKLDRERAASDTG